MTRPSVLALAANRCRRRGRVRGGRLGASGALVTRCHRRFARRSRHRKPLGGNLVLAVWPTSGHTGHGCPAVLAPGTTRGTSGGAGTGDNPRKPPAVLAQGRPWEPPQPAGRPYWEVGIAQGI